MNSQVLFPHIGKVIASTGSRHFPRMLHDLIRTQLAVDATHISQLRVDAGGNSPPEQHTPKHIAGFSSGAFCQPLAHARPSESAAQLHLTSRTDDYRYVISVYRSNLAHSFSPQERIILQDFSSLLLPMVEKHITAIHPQVALKDDHLTTLDNMENQGMETLRQRFADRLSQSGLDLSTRETQVCVGLLAGRTAPELAEQFNLKVNTVESYLKRASIKMGISGRHSLIRWMYSTEDATQPLGQT
ncbi:helix-turn-helix transcriptional regulator [Pseudomonas purpurea]|uniref:helix-turn-helix transcriptional regulator n=1 Tax=Pseudomonas purpurea TaxID=3136737 RepID=UPI003263F8D7